MWDDEIGRCNPLVWDVKEDYENVHLLVYNSTNINLNPATLIASTLVFVLSILQKATRVIFLKTQLAFSIFGFLIHCFNQPLNQKKIFFNSRKFQKAKLEFTVHCNYLHSIYIALGIISNLEIILST